MNKSLYTSKWNEQDEEIQEYFFKSTFGLGFYIKWLISLSLGLLFISIGVISNSFEGKIFGLMTFTIYTFVIWIFKKECFTFRITRNGIYVKRINGKREFFPFENVTCINLTYAKRANCAIHFELNGIQERWNYLVIRQIPYESDWITFFNFLHENNIPLKVDKSTHIDIQSYYDKTLYNKR